MNKNKTKSKRTISVTAHVPRQKAAGLSSNIQITFEGMMILFISDERPYCDVGVLKHAPGHEANILITRIPEYGAPEEMLHLHGDGFEPRMWLDVEKFEAGITLFMDDHVRFDRATGHGNPIDFRWALDFEGKEMYTTPTMVDPTAFKTIIRINDGIFYTQERSDNGLVKKPWKADEVYLGRVAVRIRANITLNDESAFFQNGINATPLELPAAADINYGIYISQARTHHATAHERAQSQDIDAENYNFAVAVDLPHNRKIHLGRDVRNTPDATCLVPTMSQSEILES
jgi:hypothetical protein